MWVGIRRIPPCSHIYACPLFFSRLLARRRKMAPRSIVVKGGVVYWSTMRKPRHTREIKKGSQELRQGCTLSLQIEITRYSLAIEMNGVLLWWFVVQNAYLVRISSNFLLTSAGNLSNSSEILFCFDASKVLNCSQRSPSMMFLTG